MNRFDIVIIGAGTAGLYSAYLLSSLGFSTCVVEQKPIENLYKVTGDAIGKHHVEQHRIDVNDIVENYYRGALVYSPNEDLKLRVPGEGYALDIAGWSRKLLRMATSKGAEIWDATTFIKPIVDGDKVCGVVVKRRDGATFEVKASVVVDASGATGVVRTRLPWKDHPLTEPLKPEDASYAYREVVELKDIPGERDHIRIYLNQDVAPGGYWWLFPKRGNIANVGLGIWGKYVKERGLNPADHYRKYLLKRKELQDRKIINAGGGIVPTRRPLDTLVWNNIVTVGDAALTVNPVHGGGLGPALLSARLASETIADAWERGDLSATGLWSYNLRYIEIYGRKQAKLDIFRLALQHMSNEEIQKGLEAGIVTENEVLILSSEGKELSVFDKVKKLLRMRKVPLSLARKLILAFTYMRKIEKLYGEYPESPEKLEVWSERVRKLYSDYLRGLRR
ncbi:MAG: NAD(P)/FAD-dependent oxidoreductase [Crenarchaeota archaeon]|nr:NAD(P)/FAD-dependent oxidoreductase [Thermoproteota archaeon]